MSKGSQEVLSHACDSPSGWNIAIREAERQVAEAEKRIERLRVSIGAFKEFQEKGEPWPGEKGLMGQDSDL